MSDEDDVHVSTICRRYPSSCLAGRSRLRSLRLLARIGAGLHVASFPELAVTARASAAAPEAAWCEPRRAPTTTSIS